MKNILYNNFEYLHKPGSILKRLMFPLIDKSRKITCKTYGDRVIKVRLSEPVGKAIFLHGIYDLSVSEGILRLLRSGDSYADIGANVGYTALLASTVLSESSRIHAFEPHPTTLDNLKENLGLNSCKAIVYPFGLSNVGGSGKIHAMEDGHLGAAKLGVEGIPVNLRRLDDLQLEIDFIKIDVEGHELMALKGGKRTLQSVRDLIFEDESLNENVRKFLQDLGFKLFKIGRLRSGPQLYPLPDRDRRVTLWEPQNTLATRDSKNALSSFATPGWRCLWS